MTLTLRKRPPSRRGRRRYDQEPPRRVLLRGAVVFAVLGLLGWLAMTLYSGVPGRDYRFVQASVPRIGGLIAHDPVRIGGVRVGQVKSIAMGERGATALELQIEPGTKIPADTQILIRANGLLGARYVELVPGRSPRQLADGQSLRGGERSLTLGAVDALDTFDARTRGALRPLLAELGTGLAGRGRDVNDLLRIGSREIVPTKQLFATLHRSRGAVGRLLPSLQSAMAPLDDSRTELAQLFVAGDQALAPLVSERSATRSILEESPPTLADANAGLSAARPLLAEARTLAVEARETLPTAPAGLRQAALLLRESDQPLARARELLDAVGPTVPAALKLTSAVDPLLGRLRPMLADLTSMVHKVAPYGCDITNFGAVFRSMTGLGTKAGGGPGGPAMQFRLQAAATPLTETLSLVDSTGMVVRDGYPRPCQYLSKPYPIIQRPR